MNQKMSTAELNAALEKADLNALRMSLLQLTGDPVFSKMETYKQPVWGGVFNVAMVDSKHHDTIKKRALEVLLNPPADVPPPPSFDESKRLMKLYTGDNYSNEYLRLGYEELAFEPHPRNVEWTKRPSDEVLSTYHATVVGCGASGIVIAVLLEHLGIPYTVIERESGVGGTWWVHKYPDCRVDIQSHAYQFKFEKQYPWSEHYPTAPESAKYMNHVVDKYGIRPHLRLATRLLGATWDEESGKWTVRIAGPDGKEEILRSNFVFNATGQFTHPKLPKVEGIQDFKGKIFHSARWDTSYSHKGKRIALVGAGATGVQMVPPLAEEAKSLTIYQRTPQWVVGMPNYREKITAGEHYLSENMPYYWNWLVYANFVKTHGLEHLTIIDQDWIAKGGLISEYNDRSRRYMKSYILEQIGSNEELAKKLIPSYPPMARRVIVDSGWFDSLKRDNVELVTDKILRFTPEGIVSADGQEREFDLVVSATGFAITDYFGDTKIVGRNGKIPAELWAKDGPRAYLSLMLPNFPNFFIFYGPNATATFGGLYTWIECWARYSVTVAKHVIESGLHSAAVTEAGYTAYNEKNDEAQKLNVRGGGKEYSGSYYVNEFGRAATNMPFGGAKYHDMLSNPDFNDFDLR
ncbi:flavin-containing monooxygenase [Bradyrhizobium sp. AZCC 2289]|uniref:flavin-containing monooxygenase n=1 Tax=Bradyrhizobium sp. AZCC 2289 TaxID=3117026 RepID=UPI002FF3E496